MFFEAQDDDLCNDYYYSSDDHDGFMYDYTYNYPNSSDEERSYEESSFLVGIASVPQSLLQTTAAIVQPVLHKCLPRAWMRAIAQNFPETSLADLRARDPSLLPPWLLQGIEIHQAALVLQRGGIFARSEEAYYSQPFVRHESPSILAATSNCRFREGFASEGMLCNIPPIPLRVLDFLEHTEDLVNLALVCKATHQAGHVLLQREFPSGLGPAHLTYNEIIKAIKQRKWSMLKSALRHPISSTTASASTIPALTKPWARTAEETDHLSPDILVFVEMDERKWDALDWCMSTLLWAKRSPPWDPQGHMPPHPSIDWLLHDGGIADEWRSAKRERLDPGIVLDREAVIRAVAHWEALENEDPGLTSRWSATDAKHVLRVVRAAARDSQGVIVHRGCVLGPMF